MKLTDQETTFIAAIVLALFSEEESLPEAIKSTSQEVEFEGGLKLVLTLERTESE